MLKKSLGALFLVLGISLLNVSAQTDQKIKSISKGVVNGSAVSMPVPVYPAAARAVGASGAVNVQVLIDEIGNVISATAVSGHPLLRQASVQAALNAKFKPTSLSGTPVRVTGVIVYSFVPPTVDGMDSVRPLPKSGIIIKGDRDEEVSSLTDKNPVLNGLAIDLVKPQYPAAARAVRASGTVTVKVSLDEEGNVVSAEAISGHPLLRAGSVNAALLSKFKPTLLSGQPVKVEGILVYNFILPPTESDSANDENSDDSPKIISAGVVNGKALSLPKPAYPAEARKEKAGGAVTVQVTIDEQGDVVSAKAVSGHELLRDASEQAALGAKFSPTLLEGIPVKVRGVVVYNFVP